MRSIIIYLFLSYTLCYACDNIKPTQVLHVTAAKSNKVVSFGINHSSGELQHLGSIDIPRPSGMSLSPDGQFIYVLSRVKRSCSIVTLRIEAAGKLKEIHKASIPVASNFLSIGTEGKCLFTSNYSSGCITSYKLEDGIFRGKVIDRITTAARPHWIGMSKQNYVYVPHTAPNRIDQFHFDEKSLKLTALDPPFVAGPKDENISEPRHIVFHKSGKMLYSSNEKGGVSSWKVGPSGKLELAQTMPSRPDNKWTARPSDLKLSPDCSFLYLANRDPESKTTRKNDSVSVFKIDQKTGRIVNIVSEHSFPAHSRCFEIDLGGNFLYATGLRSSKISVYRIDKATGKLTNCSKIECGESPMWMVIERR